MTTLPAVGAPGNPYFANVGDVVKHLVLAEVLAAVRPVAYREAHAGAPVYALAGQRPRPLDVREFSAAAAGVPALAGSAYAGRLGARPGEYPGSTGLAADLAAPGCRMLLCDTDPVTREAIAAWAAERGVAGRVEVVAADGPATLVARVPDDPPGTVSLIDPFEIAAEPGGADPLDAFSALAAQGERSVLWYPVRTDQWAAGVPEAARLAGVPGAWTCEVRIRDRDVALAAGLAGCGLAVAAPGDGLAGALDGLVAALLGAMPDLTRRAPGT